jgi:uncharacterized protein YwqG
MNFLKKIFKKKSKPESHFDRYRKDLNDLGLSSISDLNKLVVPLIRQATKIDVLPASRPPENSQLKSHFGGQPYFEEGELWPTSKRGESLDFIFQIVNSPNLELPENIALVQFYYSWNEFPWDTDNDGWLVKVYSKIDKEGMLFIERPADLERSKYCELSFKSVKSLPDWEGIDLHCNDASKLSCVLNEDEPWDAYRGIVVDLAGEEDFQSQLGGYPKWIQGEATPNDEEGNPMKLLFQIDSEDNAGLMWGDVGLIYVFYDEKSGKIEFTLQCH